MLLKSSVYLEYNFFFALPSGSEFTSAGLFSVNFDFSRKM